MINLANCYEQQQRYTKAIIWYEFALWVAPDSDEAHYGISLCCLKDGDSKKALNHINEAIKTIKEPKQLKKEKIHLTYIRAICLKLVKDY